MRRRDKAIMMYKIFHGHTAPYLKDMFNKQKNSEVYGLRNSKLGVQTPQSRASHFRNSFSFTGAVNMEFTSRKF